MTQPEMFWRDEPAVLPGGRDYSSRLNSGIAPVSRCPQVPFEARERLAVEAIGDQGARASSQRWIVSKADEGNYREREKRQSSGLAWAPGLDLDGPQVPIYPKGVPRRWLVLEWAVQLGRTVSKAALTKRVMVGLSGRVVGQPCSQGWIHLHPS